jgi:outer membrane protein assembly factor BamD (BamD/ComL family)
LKRFFILYLLLVSLTWVACNKHNSPPPQAQASSSDPQIEDLQSLIAKAHYEEAAKKAKDLVAQNPNAPMVSEALYLEAYALIFGEKDYPGARTVLKQFLDFFPQNPHAVEVEQWIGDCHFWEANYDRALKEYHKLAGAGKDIEPYALYQQANCLLLKDKVGDALTTYRSLVEKYPASFLSDSAQLMVANTYMKLQDHALAKAELQKFIAQSKNPNLLRSARKALQDMNEGKADTHTPEEKG